MNKFALIGAAGYVAPKHMSAIKKTSNQLTAAFDPNDSVGILDRYFPDCHFFTEYEILDRHLHKMKGTENQVGYISICSPNYLHDAHIRFALRSGCHAICEKPLVLNPWNLDALQDIEAQHEHKINTILQLRLHPSIVALKERLSREKKLSHKHEVDLTYITSRGRWYEVSWKGDLKKSGGIATNIGIHFFDMLHHLFGSSQDIRIHQREPETASGYIEFERARVRWFLSTDERTLPPSVRLNGQRTYRSIKIDGESLEFSNGFSDLHTLSYERILAGQGFGLSDTRAAVETVSTIRHSSLSKMNTDCHPFSVCSL